MHQTRHQSCCGKPGHQQYEIIVLLFLLFVISAFNLVVFVITLFVHCCTQFTNLFSKLAKRENSDQEKAT